MIKRNITNRERFYFLIHGKLPTSILHEVALIITTPIMMIILIPLAFLIMPHIIYAIIFEGYKGLYEREIGDDRYIIRTSNSDDNATRMAGLITFVITLALGYAIYNFMCGSYPDRITENTFWLIICYELFTFFLLSFIIRTFFIPGLFKGNIFQGIDYETKKKKEDD